MKLRDLPKCVHFKHGAFYYVKRGKWVRLGTTLADVNSELTAAQVAAEQYHVDNATRRYAMRQVARSRANAKGRRQLEHTLTWDDVKVMLDTTGWRCAVTGTPLSLAEVGPRKLRPYAPSIDRIDSDKGYVPGNCRVVCAAANMAMNAWGAGVLHTLLRNMQALSIP